MKIIDRDVLMELSHQALKSNRKRVSFNLHSEFSDTLQRMVNVLESGTYVCPHMHKYPSKREIFVILQGSLLVCEFDDDGNITSHIELNKEKGNYITEIDPEIWHTIIPLSVNTAVFECKDGPYDPGNDKIFPTWAPEEGDKNALTFNKNILDKLGFVFPEFI